MQTFTYFVSERSGIVVISFVGDLGRESLSLLPKIMEEVHSRRAQMVVVNCHDLRSLANIAIKPFSEFQKCLREIPTVLRVCFLSPDIKANLLENGALIVDELKDNLLSAVGEFLNEKKKAA